MAWNPSGVRFDSPAAQVLAEESARTFMARVYRWMTLGLLTTGGVGMYLATQPELLTTLWGMRWLLFIGQIGIVLGLSFLARKISGGLAALLFLAYAASVGVTVAVLFHAFELGTIGRAFLLTGGTFAALSIYGTVTKRNLSAWGAFLFIGLIGVILASVVAFFFPSPGLSFVISCACVVVFAGLTAYDTQRLRQYHASAGYSSAMSLSIVGALILYLDFINLFFALVQLLGGRRR